MRQPAKHHYQLTKKISLVSALINFLLGFGKIMIGWFGHSQALFADGVHSLSDLITDCLVILAAKAGSQAPDKEHPYGHGRIETVVIGLLSALIIAVGVGIVWEALHVIFAKHAHPAPNAWVIVMAGLSCFANEAIYRVSYRTGKKIQSNLLIANAWHHRSDAWSSLIVLIGAVGTLLLHVYFLDALAAIILSAMILHMGIQMAWDSIKELIDTGADEVTTQKIMQTITQTSGVKSVHQLRTRSIAGRLFVDVHILVDSWISVSEGHYISDQVYNKLHQEVERINDITVHVDPEDDELQSLSDRLPTRSELQNLLKQRWQGCLELEKILSIHLDYLNGKLYIRVTLPFSVLNDVQQAEKLSQQYQQAVQDLPYIAECKLNFLAD